MTANERATATEGERVPDFLGVEHGQVRQLAVFLWIRLDEYEISPYKKNIELDVFALGWLPHWLFTADGRTELAPAYTAE